MNSKIYFWFNCTWAGIITAMFIYAGFFAYGIHSVTCVYKNATGKACAACGLTRAFHHILVGEFSAAGLLNPLSMQLFLFFIIQLLMRLFFIMYKGKEPFIQRRLVYDIAISIAMFSACFYPLIKNLFV